MIISKTPFRMSFFGGGTDMPEFFKEHGGAVLSTTFDKYCYVNVRHLPPFFKYTSEIVYSRIERVKNVNKIKHPLVKNAMSMLDMHELRINYEADLPARSGLGTSSSFAVGLLNAFYALKGKEIDKKRLADEAIKLERELCREAGGWQDQIAAAFGGLNRINFNAEGYTVEKVPISDERKKKLNSNLYLYYTGIARISANVQEKTKLTLKEKTNELKGMLSLLDEAQSVLSDEGRDLDDFGRLLHESWLLKKQTCNGISNDIIDKMYEKGMKAGACGGKLLGAGGGGFLLFYVRPDDSEEFLKKMKSHLRVPFEFENDGTSIIYNYPEFYNVAESREN